MAIDREARSALIMVLGLGVATLATAIVERRLRRALDRRAGYVEGYAKAVIERVR